MQNSVNKLKAEVRKELGIQSNADRIRSMTDEELARDLIPIIMEVCEDGVPCKSLFLDWLQSEAE